MDLTSRTIVVTGASSGIGRETAIVLSRLGAQLVLVARDTERLKQTASLLEASPYYIQPFDLRSVDDIPQWMKMVSKEAGPLHGLVHSAGIQATMPLRVTTDEHFADTMRINVNAAVGLVKGLRQNGVRASRSSVVLVSSVMGLVGKPGIAAYSASKGALITLTKSLALELVRDGVRVNCVAPAVVRTEMTNMFESGLTVEQFAAVEAMHPLGLGTPTDVAHAIAFLLADTSQWITGTTLVVDGGYTAH